METSTLVPTFHWWLDRIAAAEPDEGWLSACEQAGRFLALNQEFVESLAEWLKALDYGPVLEVCAGRGELAEALTAAAVTIVATDAKALPGSSVLRMSAIEALNRYRPKVVLACFAPMDSGVNEVVMVNPSVQHFIVLSARIGGHLESDELWNNSGWMAEPLPQISRWMLTRHDVWLGMPERAILQHGETWHFRRTVARASCP